MFTVVSVGPFTGGEFHMTTSDRFKLIHLGTPNPRTIQTCPLVAHTTIGKQAAGLRLKGLIVNTNI